MRIKRFSFTLYQHYFPADGERSFGEDLGKVGERMGKELGGTVEGDGAMRVKRYEVERYGIESYGVESYRIKSGTNKKREL
ncbi:hypothetical protein [Prevotella veroralis]|uniref:Uncharacterized protein n=1 Tax=Prevotella veroralis F0319 TaxID=649761 RepID=C9MPE1_9BACT|nr:hypothetical protein [Prevotella veroralis]EEX18538.1 hypothetical protein HMPREF0973_01482 [Prevotella veroralis F0319]QUB42016.1 molybdopterin converting factor [Prevotella veroralis]